MFEMCDNQLAKSFVSMADEAEFSIPIGSTSIVSIVRRVNEHCYEEELVPFC